jgi:hypothetical protein
VYLYIHIPRMSALFKDKQADHTLLTSERKFHNLRLIPDFNIIYYVILSVSTVRRLVILNGCVHLQISIFILSNKT